MLVCESQQRNHQQLVTSSSEGCTNCYNALCTDMPPSLISLQDPAPQGWLLNAELRAGRPKPQQEIYSTNEVVPNRLPIPKFQ